MTGCLHNKNNAAAVMIEYLEDSSRFMADVSITCTDCGQAFRFLGLPLGLNLNGAAMSADGQTARLAIIPADRIQHPLQGLQGFDIKVEGSAQ